MGQTALRVPPPSGDVIGNQGILNLVGKVEQYHKGVDASLIRKAFAFAEKMHDGQRRKSGDPYFIHPASVAGIIADMRLDTASVCAALLHDVIEDTQVTEKELQDLFGEEVAFLVSGVTKLGRVNFACKEDQQAESFRKMLVAMARDIRVLLVKLADRLDNMRTLQHMKPDSQERIAGETLEIYAPLAGRLGIQWLKGELEDLSFQYLSPEPHRDISENVSRVSKDGDRYIAEVSEELRKALHGEGLQVDVTGRMKHLYSIHRKMQRQNVDFDQIHDFVAFRILTHSVADCYAALGVVHARWTPVPGRFKDFVALPKPNMYQSLHTTLIGPGHRRIEVQIRTHAMHGTAEQGIAAHWKYKEQSGGLDRKDAERFSWLRQLMEFQRDVSDPAEFLDSVKVDLFSDEVYVFTPRGDVKTFPRGATPVDFAFEVHSEVGLHCVGAHVNGSIVPLRYKLRNGDVVEILTSNTQIPNKSWLDFVVTGRARARIRTYLRREERQRSIQMGKELLEREMHRGGFSYAKYFKGKLADELHAQFRANDHEELLSKVGYGKIAPRQVCDWIHEKSSKNPPSSDVRPSLLERTVRRVTGKDSAGILLEGIDNVLVRYGKCCNPLPGDPITGWITRGRGVTIHRRACPRAMELDPQRRVEASWGASAKLKLPVSLRVETNDQPGVLSDVSAALTEAGVNINEATCRSLDQERAENIFQFRVEDAAKLRSIVRQISRLDGVLDVRRT